MERKKKGKEEIRKMWVSEWVGEWMDRCMDGCLDGWVGEWMDFKKRDGGTCSPHSCHCRPPRGTGPSVFYVGQTNIHSGLVGGWECGRMDGWMGRENDGRKGWRKGKRKEGREGGTKVGTEGGTGGRIDGRRKRTKGMRMGWLGG